MATTYNPNLADRISRVRQFIGDTDIAAAEIQDETITYYLDTGGLSELGAASRLAWDLSAKYAKRADVDVDDQLQRFSQTSKQYAELARILGAQAAAGIGPPVNTASGFGRVIVMDSDVSNEDYLLGCQTP